MYIDYTYIQVVLDKAKVEGWLKGELGFAEEVTEFLVDTKGERVKVCVSVCASCLNPRGGKLLLG